MSITGVGVRLDLVGPPPVAPPHSLLNTPGVVQEDGGRWMNGVNLIGYPEDTPSTWEPCLEGTFRQKDEGTDRPQAQFDPFVVYVPVTCSTFGVSDLSEQAAAVLEATQSMGVEQVLAVGGGSGDPDSATPYMADAGVTVLGGAAVTPAVALSYLENAIGGTGRMGMIHATPAIVSAWNADKVVFEEGGNLYTINGTPVVSGDGYIGQKPDAAGALPAGDDYAWATGPVQVYLGPVTDFSLTESLDRSDNTVTFRAERPVLAVWDTSLQVAVLVDWTP